MEMDLRVLWEAQCSLGLDGLLLIYYTVEGARLHGTLVGTIDREAVRLMWIDLGSTERGHLCSGWGTTVAARLEVTAELTRGAGGNERVQELMADTARPTDGSSLSYTQMWITTVQAARAAKMPQGQRQGREIMFLWLLSGSRRR